MKNLLILTTSLLMSLYSFSQDNIKYGTRTESHVTNQDLYDFNLLKSELKGTFQFKVINSEERVLLTKDILELVKASRDQNDIVVLDFLENVKIVIPSKQEIESSSFKPLAQTIFISTK